MTQPGASDTPANSDSGSRSQARSSPWAARRRPAGTGVSHLIREQLLGDDPEIAFDVALEPVRLRELPEQPEYRIEFRHLPGKALPHRPGPFGAPRSYRLHPRPETPVVEAPATRQ